VSEVVWAPEESYVEVVPMIAALLGAATRRGAELRRGCRVSGVLREGARVSGVEIEGGERIAAGAVVVCAGAAAGDIARMAGVPVPVEAEPGRLIYTTPVAARLSRPIHAPGVHFRPDGAGRIVLADAAHDILSERASGPWSPEQSLAEAVNHLPALAGARVEAVRIGRRPMPPDRLPLVGPLPGLEGLYMVVSHSGVTLGPLWGRIAAAELSGVGPDPRLASFRPARLVR
jgi:glycine/D-amino acid oxidase-like deaminating enzyme